MLAPPASHPCQELQLARPHTDGPDGQIAGPDRFHAAALGPLSSLFYRREIYFPEALGQEKTRFLEVCQKGGNPPRKQTRPFSLQSFLLAHVKPSLLPRGKGKPSGSKSLLVMNCCWRTGAARTASTLTPSCPLCAGWLFKSAGVMFP